MVQKYYNTAEAAKILGKTVDQVKQMLEHRELHGYRDGADWKFKVEDIDRLAKDAPPAKPAAEDDGGDVLLSEVELGQSDPGLSGTVIGLTPPARPAAGSDVHLAESDLALSALAGDSAVPLGSKKKSSSDSKSAKSDDLSLDNLTLGDSSGVVGSKSAVGSSAVDLGGKSKDDDLVLGGSSGGLSSNIVLGSDSGISLVDPSDSGFSLDTPVNLAAAPEESLELREDDMIASANAPHAGELKPDDDFLLTPLEETTDTDGSESGSQVIALDTEGEESGTMIGAGSGVSMAAMIDEDISPQPGLEMGAGGPLAGPAVLGLPTGSLAEGGAVVSAAAAVAEPPYTAWQIAGLAACSVLLGLCGIMMYDLVRSMWSWEQPSTIGSGLMNTIGKWVGL
ncbi:MAG: helix-turn-helix domain-containing protein [Thermoguttaceae bacterium]